MLGHLKGLAVLLQTHALASKINIESNYYGQLAVFDLFVILIKLDSRIWLEDKMQRIAWPRKASSDDIRKLILIHGGDIQIERYDLDPRDRRDLTERIESNPDVIYYSDSPVQVAWATIFQLRFGVVQYGPDDRIIYIDHLYFDESSDPEEYEPIKQVWPPEPKAKIRYAPVVH